MSARMRLRTVVVGENEARSVNGTWTWTCTAAAAAVRGGTAPGLLAEGSKRYSMSVKSPSGGTNKSTFDCAKRFSLCGWLGFSSLGRRGEYEPNTGMEGWVGDGV
jgi:hypothetical protein